MSYHQLIESWQMNLLVDLALVESSEKTLVNDSIFAAGLKEHLSNFTRWCV